MKKPSLFFAFILLLGFTYWNSLPHPEAPKRKIIKNTHSLNKNESYKKKPPIQPLPEKKQPSINQTQNVQIKTEEDFSWFYEPQFDLPFSLSDPRYDSFLLYESENQRDHSNPWREITFKEFNTKNLFFVRLYFLKDPRKTIDFKLKLKRDSNSPKLYPDHIQHNLDRSKFIISYKSFESKHSKNEIYVGLLSFPFDSFWKKTTNTHCDEITLIYQGLFSYPEETTVSGFDGRVFCRTGLKKLTGIAHFNASTKEIL